MMRKRQKTNCGGQLGYRNIDGLLLFCESRLAPIAIRQSAIPGKIACDRICTEGNGFPQKNNGKEVKRHGTNKRRTPVSRPLFCDVYKIYTAISACSYIYTRSKKSNELSVAERARKCNSHITCWEGDSGIFSKSETHDKHLK